APLLTKLRLTSRAAAAAYAAQQVLLWTHPVRVARTGHVSSPSRPGPPGRSGVRPGSLLFTSTHIHHTLWEVSMRFRIAVVALAVLCLPLALRAQAPALAWGPAPPVFPTGAKMAVLAGDPSQP